jgi:DNA-binding CsgD family transcriptional regulator
MDLVERDDACNSLDQLLTESIRGKGRLAILSGATGSGKTALLHAFAERAVAIGAAFLSATGSRTERTLPLGVVRQIFQDATIDPETSEHVARMLSLGPSAPVPADLAVQAGSRLHDLCVVLLKLSENTPLVVAIDDVEYADPASLQWLLYLTRRLRSARILMVLNECAGSHPVQPLFHAEVFRQPHCHRIELPLLSLRGLAQMLGEDPDPVTGQSLAAQCHALTGGNPLLVKALLEDQRTYGRSATSAHTPLAVGPAFGNAVLTLLYRGDPVFLTVARAVAVLDEASSPAAVGQLVGLGAWSAARVEHALTAAGLLLDGRFRHPVARAAVLDNLTGENGPDVHHRAARQLYGDGAYPTAVARRLPAAGQIREPWAVPVLKESAEHALRDGQVHLAVQQLRLACDGCDHEPQRARIGALLASPEWRVSPSAVLRHLPELTGALRDGSLGGREAVAAVRHLLWHGYAEEARWALDQFCAVRDGRDPETAAEADAARLWMSLSYPPLGGCAPPSGPLSPGVAGQQLQAVGALIRTLTGADEAAIVSAEQVLERASLDAMTLGPAVAALLTLLYADRLDKADAWSAALLDASAARSTPTWTAIASAIRAEVALRRGDLPAAENHARSALTSISAQSWGVALGGPLATLIRAATAMGRQDEAAELITQPVPEATFRTPFGLPYLEARGYHYLATNRLYAALDDFETCGALMRQWHLDVPALVPWRAGAARVYLLLGQRGAAADLLHEQLTLLGDGPSHARGVSLRLLAATAELRQRPAVLRQAVEVLDAGTTRLELAYALADLSVVHRELGDLGEAETVLRRAHHLADECGAQALRRRLAAEFSAGEPDPQPALDGVNALSEAERRVAALAADGLTNREIASRLYITISTVEQHLTRVYRKLHVSRRSELRYRLRLDVPNGRAPSGRARTHAEDQAARPRLASSVWTASRLAGAR